MNNYKELIVVVSVLTIIMIVGTGAIKHGSQEWQKTVCQNNLKELYKLNVSYQNDNNYIIVPRIDRTNKRRWKYWPQYINKYCKDSMVFYCPVNPKSQNMFNLDPLEPKVFSLKSISYGLNYTLGNYKSYGSKEDSKLIKLSQALNPSYMIFLGDSNTSSLRPTKWCWEKDYAPLHFSKSNFLMLDGGIRDLSKSQLGLVSSGGKGWRIDKKRWINIK